MTDKEHKPTEEEIQAFIGKQASEAWRETKRFIEESYGIPPETLFYAKKYGWTVRYRKSGKTLCSLFPEKSGFMVLIVLGVKEPRKALAIRDDVYHYGMDEGNQNLRSPLSNMPQGKRIAPHLEL